MPLLSPILLLFLCTILVQASPYENYSVDLRQHDMATPYELSGTWQFFPNTFLTEEEVPKNEGVPYRVPAPFYRSEVLPERYGFGTFFKTVYICPKHECMLGLEVLPMHQAFTIFVNGEKIYKNGILGNTPLETEATKETSIIVPIQTTGDTLRILVHFSNFHNRRGGPWRSFFIGSLNVLSDLETWSRGREVAFFSAILTLALIFLMLHYLDPNRDNVKYRIYFSLLCIGAAFRVGLTGNRLLADIPFFSREILLRLEYGSVYFSIALWCVYLRSLYPGFFSKAVSHICLAISLLFLIATLFVSPRIYSELMPLYNTVLIFVFLYILFFTVHILIKRQGGALLLFLSNSLIVLSITHDIFAYDLIHARHMFPYGMAGMVFIQAIILSRDFSYARNHQQSLAIEMKEINQSLHRFIPQDVISLMNKHEISSIRIGDQISKQLTIMTIDIHSFTAISESLSPEDIFSLINAYHSKIGPVIERFGGVITSYLGDGIIIFFEAYNPCVLDAADALHRELTTFLFKDIRLSHSIGIHGGTVTLGPVGYKERMDILLCSSTVEIAQKIEELSRIYGAETVITETIQNQHTPPLCRHLDTLVFPHIAEPIHMYQVFSTTKDPRYIHTPLFTEAVGRYRQRDWNGAIEKFTQLLSKTPDDLALHEYIRRCTQHKTYGTPLDWCGYHSV
ncbi:adenylate/guanylate cyclase domain-containing protein [Chitinivibrio alkaliphilus]|nr:adenylate/guanylate cyclase domain-containing protein [Chitinivibrio alkaliphilus]